MLDIDIQSLKCSWVKRLKFQPYSKWVQLYETMLNKYGQQLIFTCNLNAIKDTEQLEIKSIFLKDILLAWSNVYFRDDISIIGKEIIWNNTNIKSNIKPFFLHDWADIGTVFIEHIYDYRNKQLFSFNEIHNLYNVPQTYFLMYYQLTTCIKYQWKVKLKPEEIQYNAPEYLFEKLIPQLKTCRYIHVYNAILKKKTNIQINQENKWEATMSSSFNWKIIFG